MTPEARELRARRLAAVRAHHPDLGGDVETFVRVMESFEARTTHAQPDAPIVVVTSPVQRVRRRLRAAGRTASPRTRLPATWPGARRYSTL